MSAQCRAFKVGQHSKGFFWGFYGAHSVNGIRNVARDWYMRQYEEIRAVVPKERLLEFKLEQSWGTLCAFLGHDIPEGVNSPWKATGVSTFIM
ncbi:hypothetical protein DER46DRAFT_611410 [Fusarium sp. MPI-SDFR-AT-0072]|nr:hypothetical protein DER46DRAFT_611410 [Fusarium sp. MPI-SDFR-AT-0072]